VIVLDVPSTLDFSTVDSFLGTLPEGPGRTLLDARHLRFVDPHGMLGLLAAGTVLRQRQGTPAALRLPGQGEVPGYLARMGFFREGEELFQLEAPAARKGGGDSEVLLEITPITSHGDVHTVVDRVQARAGTILSRTLRYPPTAVIQFSVMLSEVCQNIVEHSDASGWVAAQAYNWSRRLGRHVLVLAVWDMGKGFLGSLAPQHAARFGERWSDAAALEAAFIHGISRFPEPGRGQGIQQIRKLVRRFGGLVAVRSGTARIADAPEWDATPPLEDGLPSFPGSRITIVLPERLPEAPEGRGAG